MKKVCASHPEREKKCRKSAAEVLLRVEQRHAYTDILLDQSLKKVALSARDRALLTQLVYGTLRWKGRIDWCLSQFLHLPLSDMNAYLRTLLRLTLYQILFLDKIPDHAAVNEGVNLAKRYGGVKAGALVNGVLRKILREKDQISLPDAQEDANLYLSVLWSHPDWLVSRWLAYFGRKNTESLLRANNEEAPLTLRTNLLKGDRESLLKRLHGIGLHVIPTPWSPQGIWVKSGSAVDRLPGFQEGLFQVQGEASQLIGYLLDPKPGERVLDGCAAPGGKTTHFAELMQGEGEIIATDISRQGLEKLKQNVRRLELISVHPYPVDLLGGLKGRLAVPYDRILVDAPCSGLGTLRSHPEAKWRRTERDIQRLGNLQKKLVGQLARYLKSGGVLVYATCTLTREENEQVVESFLDRQPDFVLEDARDYLPREARHLTSGKYYLALPHKHNTDGFFAARMRKAL
ncbi:MAG: 16S rRNA (cytosine(967)-C(5))-methyltransferase RsmB [Candidatus Binatia bacterium]